MRGWGWASEVRICWLWLGWLGLVIEVVCCLYFFWRLGFGICLRLFWEFFLKGKEEN